MSIFGCPHCGGKFKAENVGQYVCPHCGKSFMVGLNIVAENPWETRHGRTVIRAFFETWKKAIFAPVSFFRLIRPKEAIAEALLYGIVCQSIALFVTWVYEVGFNLMPVIYSWFAAFSGWGMFDFSSLLAWPVFPYYMIIVLTVSPFISIISILFTSCVYHVCLMILGAAKNGFSATLKGVSYGASAQVFSIVPIVGTFVAAVWSVVLSIIALKEIHQTTYGRVIFAVLLPIFLCCGFIIGIAALLIGVFMQGYNSVV